MKRGGLIFRGMALTSIFLGTQLTAQTSLSLRDAVRSGLEHGPLAQVSADRAEVQRAQVAEAKARPNPRLYVQSEDLRPWDKNFSFADNTEDYGYMGQTFELGGKRGKRIAYAESGVRRSEAQHTLELRQVAAEIANAYWAAGAAREAVAEWKKQLDDFDRIVKYQQDRVDAGATAGVDLLRTKVERDRVVLSYAQSQREMDEAEIELARRAALPTVEKMQLSDVLEQERPVEVHATADAVEQRLDVAAARESVNASRADLRLQHAGAVPNVDFLGGYKRNAGVDTLYGAMQIDLPFFNRNQGGIAAAAANDRLAADELAYARVAAKAEIDVAASAYRREEELVHRVLPGMGERAVENAAIIGEAYRSGGADLLRYLDAERMLIETRLLAIQTWSDYQRAAVALHLAYGEEP